MHRLPYSAINFLTYERVMAHLSAGRPGRHREDASPVAVRNRLLAGATAGMVACSATYPLDLCRTRLATQTTTVRYAGVLHCLHSIAQQEGPPGLYRGLGATLCGVAPTLAINFAAYDTMRARLGAASPDAPPSALAMLSGSAAGAASATVCFPLDLVRRRMQLPPQPGEAGGGGLPRMLAVASGVMRRDGVRGFYRGIVPELAKARCSGRAQDSPV